MLQNYTKLRVSSHINANLGTIDWWKRDGPKCYWI